MSRKRDPVIAVLNYFEEAEPALAAQALTLAQQIVRRRLPKGPQARSKAKSKPAAAGSPTPPPGVAPAPSLN